MAESSYEFAIFGSTPMAGLLAGLLANVHKKRVCLVGDPMSAYRLARGLDLSAMPATRPETWALLTRTRPETIKLIGKIAGRAGFRRIDPIIIGETPAGVEALAHMSHVARGFGQSMERIAEFPVTAGGAAYRLRDIVDIRRTRFEPLLEDWLARSNVGRISARIAAVTLRRDGSARIDAGGRSYEATHSVLADDAAILNHLDVDERDRVLRVETTTTLLTEPARRLTAPVMIYLDRGVILNQRASRGIAALSTGRPDQALARIGSSLGRQENLRRAGQTVFKTIATVDGAPLVGPTRAVKATVLAGLGVAGAFLAPALARLIAGVASDAERSYFSAHEAGRGSARAIVADYQGALALEAQQ